jgi:hypothetical protein
MGSDNGENRAGPPRFRALDDATLNAAGGPRRGEPGARYCTASAARFAGRRAAARRRPDSAGRGFAVTAIDGAMPISTGRKPPRRIRT